VAHDVECTSKTPRVQKRGTTIIRRILYYNVIKNIWHHLQWHLQTCYRTRRMMIQLHIILANRYTKDITAPQWSQFSGSVTAFICFHRPITSQTWLPNLLTPRLPRCYRTPPTSLLHPPLGLWPHGIMGWSRSNLDAISMVQRQLMETTWYNRIATHFFKYNFYIQTYDLWLMRDNFMVIEDPYIFSRITVWITLLQTWRSSLRLSSQLVWIQDALV